MKNTFNIIALFLFLITHTELYSQVKLYQENSKFYVQHKTDTFDVDTTIVIVKIAPNAILPNNIIIKKINKLGYADIEVPKGVSFNDFVGSLKENPDILSVEYNCYGKYLTNDPSYSNQWYLSDIQINEAWDITTPSVNELIIAVIDGGFDIGHTDLGFGDGENKFTNIYRNKNEVPYNWIDDDENGCIDGYNGMEFSYRKQ